jgi:hypothetical protein
MRETFGGPRREAVTVRPSPLPRLIAGALAFAVCGCLVLSLLAGCGSGAGVTTSSSPTGVTTPSASATPAWPAPQGDLSTSIAILRSGFKSAFASGRTGAPFRAAPLSVIVALKRYFATVDPAEFNGASRVAFVWAFTVPREPDGHRSTDTRQYVEAYFLADGPEMVAAGSMAAGFNAQLMSLSRSSAQAAWRVEGLYYP